MWVKFTYTWGRGCSTTESRIVEFYCETFTEDDAHDYERDYRPPGCEHVESYTWTYDAPYTLTREDVEEKLKVSTQTRDDAQVNVDRYTAMLATFPVE